MFEAFPQLALYVSTIEAEALKAGCATGRAAISLFL
jgi:hypothetical protein